MRQPSFKHSLSSLLVGSLFLLSGSAAVAAEQARPKPASMQQVVASNDLRQLHMLNRNDTVLLLVDHQIGLFTGVRDIPVADLKHNVVALAKAAHAMGIPVVMTATMPDGLWGPTIPELTAALPGVPVINRTVINAWDEKKVRDAIQKTGRKTVLIAGVSLEVCASFPALSATADGFDARVILDASGTFNSDNVWQRLAYRSPITPRPGSSCWETTTIRWLMRSTRRWTFHLPIWSGS